MKVPTLSSQPSPNERGLALEQRLERLFRNSGYHVVHNTWVVGRSGTKHQVDVLASFEAPLHTSKVVVEAKAYEGAVDKDRVMKLIHIVSDVGADRGIIVTTSRFTPDAIRTAEGYSIDLWDREHLRQLLGEIEIASLHGGIAEAVATTEQVVVPKIDLAALRSAIDQQVAKRARGTLGIGRVIESIHSLQSINYPYYEADLSVRVEETQRVGLLRKEQITKTTSAVVSFDALTGIPVEPGQSVIAYQLAWMSSLHADEISVLRATRGISFSAQSITALGLSDTRSKRAVASLLAKGCIQRLSTRPVTYKCLQSLPSHPSLLRSISGAREVAQHAQSDFERFRATLIEPAALMQRLRSYWPSAAVDGLRVLYYPYYIVAYSRTDGSTRSEIIDAVTGIVNEPLGRILKVRIEEVIDEEATQPEI